MVKQPVRRFGRTRIKSPDPYIEPPFVPAPLAPGSDTTAIHDNLAGEIVGIDEKTAPIATDNIVLEDSEASNVKKRAQIENLLGAGTGTITVTGTSHSAGSAHIILVDDDTAGAQVTIDLPAAVGTKAPYYIKKLGNTAAVVIDPNGAETIDGASTATLATQHEALTLASDGSNWQIL